MAPYDFEAPDADVILRCSDGKDLRVHKLILSYGSPVFESMFSLPQPTKRDSQIPIIDVSESSHILKPLIQFFYPRTPPKVLDLAMWEDLYAIADKYNAEATLEMLREMLVPRFVKTSPFRVYALASRLQFVEEAKAASTETLKTDISKGFPEDDVKLMDSVACQKLYNLHIARREKARAWVNSRPYPYQAFSCNCPPLNPSVVSQVLTQHVSTTPWLSLEDTFREVAGASNPRSSLCTGSGCRNSFQNIHTWISTIWAGVQNLPKTI